MARARVMPNGAVRIPATLTRTGVLTYRRHDGSTQREFRPADEVFSAESLETLMGAPLTEQHPKGMVDPTNHRDLAVGHVGDNVRQDNAGHVAADVLVTHADAIAAVTAGQLVEISCGYSCTIDPTPGEYEGERYDVVQRAIRYNHAALLPAGTGRAGATVRLRLDAEGHEVDGDGEPAAPDQIGLFDDGTRADAGNRDGRNKKTSDGKGSSTGKRPMAKAIKVGGNEYDPTEDGLALAQACARLDSDVESLRGAADAAKAEHERALAATRKDADDLRGQVATLTTSIDAVTGERDAALAQVAENQKRIDALAAELADAKSPAVLDARVAERTALIDTARLITGKADLRFDGKSDAEIRRDTVAAIHGDAKVEGKSETYIAAAFEYLAETHRADASHVRSDAAPAVAPASTPRQQPAQQQQRTPPWAQPLDSRGL